MYKSLLTAAFTVAILSACGGSSNPLDPTDPDDMTTDPSNPDPTPSTDSAVRNANGTVSIDLDGTMLALPNNNLTTTDGQPQWFDSAVLANGFETDDVFAVGGVQNGTYFSAVTGELSTNAPGGSASYTGRYALNTTDGGAESVSSPLTITYDANEATLTAADGDFSISGTVSAAGAASGTVTFEGDTAPFNGGFYGDDADIAAAFHNDNYGGVFYGSN